MKMRAAVCTKFGAPEGVKIMEVDKPAPKENEVLIKIQATTITFGDSMLRKFSWPIRKMFKIKKNHVLGHELAGVVEEVGSRVTKYKKGDHVYATTGYDGGAHAEYKCLSEDEMVGLKPENMSFQEAAAVPVGANTALDLLRKGNISEGQKVLVYGASGSVGTYAVQFAKHYGAEVTGVCSTANLEMVKSLGADRVIDYTQEDFTESGERYDIVFDTVRKIPGSKKKKALAEGGVYITTMAETEEDPADLAFIRELIEAGKIKAVIDKEYPFEDIVEAHRYVDGGHKKGNVVILIKD